MLNKFLFLGYLLIAALALFAVPFPDGAVSLMEVIILSALALAIFRRFTPIPRSSRSRSFAIRSPAP